MNSDQVTYLASDFKYPNEEEREAAKIVYPKLSNFGFKYVKEITSIIKEVPKHEVQRKSHLFYWDICLENRFAKLSDSYDFIHANFNRGFPDNVKKMLKSQFLNYSLFDYYSEIFYYHFFSSLDNIGQIINVYYRLKLKENRVEFKKIAPKIEKELVKKLITDFIKSIEEASEFRNAFTHRFPPNYPDYRSHLSEIDKQITYSTGRGNFIKPSEFMENINDSLFHLERLMENLKKEILPSK